MREASVAHRLRTPAWGQTETEEVARDVWYENRNKGFDLCEMAHHYHRLDTALSCYASPRASSPRRKKARLAPEFSDCSLADVSRWGVGFAFG